ncbi:dihydrodipicolinate synthase family protein [Variovorax sp. J22P271]|uniref:dihydrodipicolinate synthase family protein n=1 Tax=Variovorax davisae TaxID=3053515 RepID=UPI0025756D62|nr:dihydrodipicolinate synthase family protein [Variovorax sp. J22P271]MDM0032390.1 dihydrodipicolinate synthase family protein [Variovorax sp. J22P271]
MAAPKHRAELKPWARERLRGIQNLLFPSYLADFSGLCEEGIRRDVEQSIRHGFVSTHCATEAGLTFDEAKRFVEIVADAAKGRILVSTTAMFDTLDRNVEFLKHAEKVGCDLALVGYPPSYYPPSPDDVERATLQMLEAAQVGFILYPSFKYNFARFSAGGFPLDVLERLARHQRVVAVLCAITEPAYVSECFERCAEHALVQCPWERWFPLAVTRYGQQWAGPGAYEIFQSPDEPRLVNYFRQLLDGQRDEAMESFWRLTPARLLFEKQFMPTQMLGTYHWPQQKYYQWLTGGNGGYTRQPVMRMQQHEMDEARSAVRALGIVPPDNDYEFFVGRVQYAQGKRPW